MFRDSKSQVMDLISCPRAGIDNTGSLPAAERDVLVGLVRTCSSHVCMPGGLFLVGKWALVECAKLHLRC